MYNRRAGTPPMVTRGSVTVSEWGNRGAALPLAGGKVTGPRPRAKISRISSRRTGRESGVSPRGAASAPDVFTIKMAPWPGLTSGTVKMAGLY